RCRLIFAAVLAALLTGIAGVWWLCDKSDSIAFLPGHAGAEWIMDAAPAVNIARPAMDVTTVFKKSFWLNANSSNASMDVAAFKRASVQINGQAVNGPWSQAVHWKAIKRV